MLNKYIKLLETLEEDVLLEMATTRRDAIMICQTLGEEILEHFLKCIEEGFDDINFKHHCGEIQGWFSRAERIVLKETKKKINNEQLRDWCFYQLSTPECLIQDSNIANMYTRFTDTMLRYRGSEKLVSEVFYDIS